MRTSPRGLPPAPAGHGLPGSTCLLPPGTSSFMGAPGSGGSSLLASSLLLNKRAVAAALRGGAASARRLLRGRQPYLCAPGRTMQGCPRCSGSMFPAPSCSGSGLVSRSGRWEAADASRCLAAAGRLEQGPGGSVRNARSRLLGCCPGRQRVSVGLTDVPSDRAESHVTAWLGPT